MKRLFFCDDEIVFCAECFFHEEFMLALFFYDEKCVFRVKIIAHSYPYIFVLCVILLLLEL